MQNYIVKFFVLFYLLIFSTYASFDPRSEYTRASSLYDAREFDKAISIYKGIIGKGFFSADIYYNLGNCFFRLGNYGEAMAAFLAAKRYMPRDPDVSANLQYLKDRLVDKLDAKSPTLFYRLILFFSSYVSSYELARGVFFFLALGCLLLLLSRKIYNLQIFKSISYLSILVGFILLVFLGLHTKQNDIWGAVIINKAQIFSAPSSASTVLFELNEGAPLAIKDRQNSWYRISLSDGKKGWVSDSDINFY